MFSHTLHVLTELLGSADIVVTEVLNNGEPLVEYRTGRHHVATLDRPGKPVRFHGTVRLQAFQADVIKRHARTFSDAVLCTA